MVYILFLDTGISLISYTMLLFSLYILPAMGHHVRFAGHSRLNTTSMVEELKQGDMVRTLSAKVYADEVFHFQI